MTTKDSNIKFMTPARDPKQIKESCRRSCNHVAVIMEEGYLESSGVICEVSGVIRSHLGVIWEASGVIWSHLGGIWSHLGATWRP